MKYCPKCEKDRDESEFNKNTFNKKTGLSSWCSDCTKERNNLRYKENKIRIREIQKEYVEKRRKWFTEYKSTLKCSRCPENHPSCLEFHHIDPKTKRFEISESINKKIKLKEEILEEIKKCEILCSNCHRKLHWKEKNI